MAMKLLHQQQDLVIELKSAMSLRVTSLPAPNRSSYSLFINGNTKHTQAPSRILSFSYPPFPSVGSRTEPQIDGFCVNEYSLRVVVLETALPYVV
jgi:hypothetical protein